MDLNEMLKDNKPLVRHYTRKFLNEEEGTALIEVSASLSSWSLECEILLSDCYKAVRLDMSVYEVADYQKKIDKINIILEEVSKAKDFLKNNIEKYKEQVAKNKHNRELLG